MSPDGDVLQLVVTCASCGSRTAVAPSRLAGFPCGACTRPLIAYDPHAVLGADPRQKGADVATAYTRLAQIYHPDRYGTASDDVRMEAEQRMKMLNDARNFLQGRVEYRDAPVASPRIPSYVPPTPHVPRPAPVPDSLNPKLTLGGGAAIALAAFLPWTTSHNTLMGAADISGVDLKDGWWAVIAGLVLIGAGWTSLESGKPAKGLVITVAALMGLFFFYQFGQINEVMSAGAPAFVFEYGMGLYLGIAGAVAALVGGIRSPGG